jgi:hypothetical protein
MYSTKNKFSKVVGNKNKVSGNKKIVFGNSIKVSGNKKFVFGNKLFSTSFLLMFVLYAFQNNFAKFLKK